MFNKDLTIYDVNLIIEALEHYNDYLEGSDDHDTRTHCQGLMDEFEEMQKELYGKKQ